MADKERPKAVRMLIEANKAQRYPHVTDIESERPVAVLVEPGIHLQGEAGRYVQVTLTVLPLLDIVAEAELRFVCPLCKKPTGHIEKKAVRIISNGIAIYSNLTFTDFFTGKALGFISDFEADITTSEHGAKATAVLSCIDVLDSDAKIGTFHSLNRSVPHGMCEYCERVIESPHHKNCSCPDCSERKRQEYEALMKDEALAI
jgi:Zn finger protein HypA/HybF involved in hydrogenase expression